MWHDEDTHQAMWALDMTAGRVPENEKNALLCRGSKELMCLMHMQGSALTFKNYHSLLIAMKRGTGC